MAALVDRVRARVAKHDLAGALELLVESWGDEPAGAVGDAVDWVTQLIGGPRFTGTTKQWLAAARSATHVERGRLLAAIAGRTAADTLACLKVAVRWRDPRLTNTLFVLLAKLPWAGARSRDTWRVVFEHVAKHGDPRFVELAGTLPATWQVGPSMQTWLTNQLYGALDGVEPIAAPDEDGLAALIAELRAAAPRPATTPATAEALLAAIYAHPEDDAPRIVYADWLQERDDVRGEFIALQLQPTAESRKRERALVKQHRKAWLGPLATVLRGEVEFRRGFPASATVTFRHQRDVEQYGALPEWATLQELEWGHQIVRDDQRKWARFVGPAMHDLRIARRPHLDHVLAAQRPWRLELLELDTRELNGELAQAALTSPLLPALQTLELYGWGSEPAWLAGITRCPPHLAISSSIDSDERDAWLAAAAATELHSLTFRQYGGIVHRFTRDAAGAFTRLDIEIRPPRPLKSLDRSHVSLFELPVALAKLRPKSLTHFAATIEVAGELVPATPVMKVGLSKLAKL